MNCLKKIKHEDSILIKSTFYFCKMQNFNAVTFFFYKLEKLTRAAFQMWCHGQIRVVNRVGLEFGPGSGLTFRKTSGLSRARYDAYI